MHKTYDAYLGMHLLEVEITTRCNLNCKHCYNRTQVIIDMPLEQIIGLIEFAEKNSVQSVVISGGEASLHPQFDQLTEFLLSEQPDVRMIVQTNGTIRNKGTELLRGFDAVHLSFESEQSGVRRSSHIEIIDLALELISVGIYAYLFATIHSENVDKIAWMVERANSSGVDIGFNLCASTGCNESLLLSPGVEKRVIKKLHALFLERRILRFTSPLVAVLNDQRLDKYSGIKGGCTAGVAACVVLPNGDVAPCPFLRIKAGNIYEVDLESIWLNSEVFKVLRNRQGFDEPCGSCDYLSYCGGCRKRALVYSDKLTGLDPYCLLR